MKKFKYYIKRNNAIYETTTLKAAISGAKQLATEKGIHLTLYRRADRTSVIHL